MKQVVRTGALLRVYYGVLEGTDLTNPVHFDFPIPALSLELLEAALRRSEEQRLTYQQQVLKEEQAELAAAGEPEAE